MLNQSRYLRCLSIKVLWLSIWYLKNVHELLCMEVCIIRALIRAPGPPCHLLVRLWLTLTDLSKIWHLCLTEATYILIGVPKTTLNKRQEVYHNCRYMPRFKLESFLNKPPWTGGFSMFFSNVPQHHCLLFGFGTIHFCSKCKSVYFKSCDQPLGETFSKDDEINSNFVIWNCVSFEWDNFGGSKK